MPKIMTTPNNDSEPSTETPTWEALAPALIEMTQSEDRKQSVAAWQELRRMAQLADRMKEFVPALNGCVHVLSSIGEDCDLSDELQEDISLAIKVADQALSGKEEKSSIITLN